MSALAEKLPEPVMAWWIEPSDTVIVVEFDNGAGLLAYGCSEQFYRKQGYGVRYATLKEAERLAAQESAFTQSMNRSEQECRR